MCLCLVSIVGIYQLSVPSISLTGHSLGIGLQCSMGRERYPESPSRSLQVSVGWLQGLKLRCLSSANPGDSNIP